MGCGCQGNKGTVAPTQTQTQTKSTRPKSGIGKRLVRVVDHYHCSNPQCEYEQRYSYPEGGEFVLTDTSCPCCSSEIIFRLTEDRAMLVGFERG